MLNIVVKQELKSLTALFVEKLTLYRNSSFGLFFSL